MLLLGFYFILVNWIFFYRLLVLSEKSKAESHSLQSVLMGASSVSESSFLHSFLKKENVNKEILHLCVSVITKDATKGLSTLSIVASTSPFIGLFGTVVSILETFSNIGSTSAGSISIIASGVSEALIATAVGIFVATFAYSYHQILKRKSFDVVSLVKIQSEALLSRN